MASNGKTKKAAAPDKPEARPLICNLDPEKRTMLIPFGQEPPEGNALPVERLMLNGPGLGQYRRYDIGFEVRPITSSAESRCAMMALGAGDQGTLALVHQFCHAVTGWFGFDFMEDGEQKPLPCTDEVKHRFAEAHPDLMVAVVSAAKRAQTEANRETAASVGNS